MKLYELPNNSYFTLPDDETKELFFFKHIDGMYSYCLDMNEMPIHFAAWTEVDYVVPVKKYPENEPKNVQTKV